MEQGHADQELQDFEGALRAVHGCYAADAAVTILQDPDEAGPLSLSPHLHAAAQVVGAYLVRHPYRFLQVYQGSFSSHDGDERFS